MEKNRFVLTSHAIKRHSKRLQQQLNQLGQQVSLMQAQEIFSQTLGFKSMHELQQTIFKESSAIAAVQEDLLTGQQLDKLLIVKPHELMDLLAQVPQGCVLGLEPDQKIMGQQSSLMASSDILHEKQFMAIMNVFFNEEEFQQLVNGVHVDKSCQHGSSRYRISCSQVYHEWSDKARTMSFSLYIKKLVLSLPQWLDYFLGSKAPSLSSKPGLVVIAGATGSGKSTFMHSLVEENLRTGIKKVVVLDNPIEYFYEDMPSKAVKILVDSHEARNLVLKKSLGAASMVVMGDYRDLDDIDYALKTVNQGCRVCATFLSSGIVDVFRRMIMMYSYAQRDEKFTTILGQMDTIYSLMRLKKDDGSSITLVEYLVFTPELKKNLATVWKTNLDIQQVSGFIHQAVQVNKTSFFHSLVNLFEQRTINKEEFLYFMTVLETMQPMTWQMNNPSPPQFVHREAMVVQ